MKSKANLSLYSRLWKTLFIAMMSVALIVLTVFSFAFLQISKQETQIHLQNECNTLASFVQQKNELDVLEHTLADGIRLTLIDSQGNVLYDNVGNPSEMENHLNRSEVLQALQQGTGEGFRPSKTLGKTSFYCAKKLDDGSILRVSQELIDVFGVFIYSIPLFIGMFICILLISAFCARKLTRFIMQPLSDFVLASSNQAEGFKTYKELMPLAKQLAHQQTELEEKINQLAGVNEQRRDFTASITHEFKTPLTVIRGAAEILETEDIEQEDRMHFAHRIVDESQRLNSLVDDILTLSRLDSFEKVEDETLTQEFELCDIYASLSDVCTRLENFADQYHVDIHFAGEHAYVYAIPRLLDEMFYNVVSNAIRYNKPSGSVYIDIETRNTQVFVRIKDTGIGIPKEQQEDIFKRFYRVDKSRSKKQGGTGLGLAIVKHIAKLFNIRYTLESEEQKGTTFTFFFERSSL